MPLVSLLVPIYNVERYLEECLESARTQSLKDIEVICINDGSTDGSRQIIQRFLDADPRFCVIDKPNSGYGASMNQGLHAATGDYVAILESDDVLEPGALEMLHDLAIAYEVPVVKADFQLYWSANERLVPFNFVKRQWEGKAMSPQADWEVFYRKPSIWSALYERAFLERNGIEFLETPGAAYQDASFNFKVWACAPKAAFTTRPVIRYRQDNEQSSVNSPGKVFCVVDEYAEMQRFLDARPSLRKPLQPVLERMKYDTYMWNFERLDDSLKDGFVQHASNEFKQDLHDGKVDLALFEPWAEADLFTLVNTPDDFSKNRSVTVPSGYLNVVRHYYRVGGVPLVAKMVNWRLRKKVAQHTSERNEQQTADQHATHVRHGRH